MITPELTEFETIRFRDLMRRITEDCPRQELEAMFKHAQATHTLTGVLAELSQEMQSAVLRRCITLKPEELTRLSPADVQPLLDAIFKLAVE